MPNLFVNARSLQAWAESLIARSTLPHVIRRLILGTLDKSSLQKIDFAANESIQRPGFDGEVLCSAGNAWVPIGHSVWEVSVEANVGRKANSDYSRRTLNTPEHIRKETTYVSATARHWSQKSRWATEKRQSGDWKDVRALDADDIEQWTETAPFGFVIWLGRQLALRPQGVEDVIQRWEAISRFAPHPLVPKVYLAGRSKSRTRVEEWLGSQASKLSITSRSPTEVIDFFCAAVADMQLEDRERVESRAVIITSTEAWNDVRDATTPSVLIVEPSLSLPIHEASAAVHNGHHVLVAEEPAFSVSDRDTDLERAPEYELRAALEASSFPPVQAEQLARSAGGSLAILKHRLSPSTIAIPNWSENVQMQTLSACLLLGGWSNCVTDKEAFCQIAGRPFSDCEAELQLMAGTQDPLLLHAAGNWRLLSKDHAWSLFHKYITPTALGRFESLAVDILADDDPRYQLRPDERFLANISGHTPKYSKTIKSHVAETLAFLGAFGSRLQAASSVDVNSTVDRIIASLLAPECTWHRWASIGSRLPLLAEASPRNFLEAVRNDLAKDKPNLITLLHEQEDELFGRCNHAGLLWALETLAWSKQYLPEVARTLLFLASRDTPRGKWSNRPSSTLSEVLSFWLPQTTASVGERIQVLDLLINTDADAAWPILVSLLPSGTGGVSNPTHRPYWRNWANEWERGATVADSVAFIDATARRVIKQAGSKADRWVRIFQRLASFPDSVHDELLDELDSYCETDIADSDRRVLWEELSKQIDRHRHFASAEWAASIAFVERLEVRLGRLVPRDTALRHAWLFADWPARFFDRGGDHADNCAALERARRNAIHEILSQQDVAGIATLLRHAQSRFVVGVMLATVTADSFRDFVIPEQLNGLPPALDFALGFVGARFCREGWSWVDDCMARCQTDAERANVLRALDFEPLVWDRAKSSGEGVERAYWETCRSFNPRLDSLAVERSVQKLVEFLRPVDAMDVIVMALHQKRVLSQETLLLPLEAILALPSSVSDGQVKRIDGHAVGTIVQELQGREDVSHERLMRIEWHFIRVLDKHCGRSPLALQRHLSESPEFFNEVLRCCFRAEDAEGQCEDVADPTEEQMYMAGHAYQLLHDWDVLPGAKGDGTVDEVQLREWCRNARQIAAETGRLKVCDNIIGQVFARSEQRDNDGAWPCREVRRVAAEIASSSLSSGMYCAIINSRGATFRASGGDQERVLAEQYRSRADRIRFESPYVAEVLDAVAERYEKEAASWDERERWESD